jgi:hypothetical protein
VQGQDFEQLELAHDHVQVLDQRQEQGSLKMIHFSFPVSQKLMYLFLKL